MSAEHSNSSASWAIRRTTLILLCVAAVLGTGSRASAEDAGAKSNWTRSKDFDELWSFRAVDPDARIYVNAPVAADGKPARATRIVIFALPNGNTIEWTLGSKMAEGMDWHYDIQHVLAQVRAYRELVPDENVVLICAEAKGRSW